MARGKVAYMASRAICRATGWFGTHPTLSRQFLFLFSLSIVFEYGVNFLCVLNNFIFLKLFAFWRATAELKMATWTEHSQIETVEGKPQLSLYPCSFYSLTFGLLVSCYFCYCLCSSIFVRFCARYTPSTLHSRFTSYPTQTLATTGPD